ncbi:D-ribose transporter ATP binding protein [Lactiplantibacillus fabifermentans T30PCM01]|uniref:D-ribose transporter ATP binding protein n=1 Tax=Lactiplantibacillus fabifermentans T30PCM01 TaxID=1400520 RepID=W6TBL9_9LACO|nr:sugar ABC transporter ATP-binding protein [Lactiplantibacillus fabifermentans]ETY72870.1 D-ribose transporter ATP binding protein [Lactiplantibacillus fabifermentans T30PCM01]
MKVELQNISKAFGANRVLEGVNLTVAPGEVHSLVGENGAGKSTLMNIFTGLLKSDGGKVIVDGQEVHYSGPLDAERHGISFIHQEMNNFAEMPVVDNMFLNKELRNKFGIVNQKEMIKQATHYLHELGSDVDVTLPIGSLTVGNQQMIEIAKSLMTNAQVIIMDEPTAALTGNEIKQLFQVVAKLKAKGVSFIYISHRMEEIFQIADRVTVMRDGVSVATYKIDDLEMKQLVHDMVGHDIGSFYPERNPKLGSVALEVKNLNETDVFQDISFKVHEGEILGFSGLMGAGRTEIMRAIFGIDKLTSGDILLNGEKVTIRTPEQAIKHDIGFLTEDRKDEGLILDDSLYNNIALPSIEGFKKHGLLDDKSINDFVEMLMKRLTVKAMGSDVSAGSLSGGNQQKVVLAKWVGSGAKVLILDEPTRGVDVGAKREIYELMNELTDRHVAIIMISSDLPEVLSMSDRIAVVYEGRITGFVDAKEATQDMVMTLATGGTVNATSR